MTTSLSEQAESFADSLTVTAQAVIGPECPAFRATVVEGADAFAIRQQPATGLILCDLDGPLLRLSVDYQCTLDGHDRYLAVQKSKIHVFVEPEGREPLFRYEFERDMNEKLPAAHIQFHGKHPELERVMAECGDSTQRAKRRQQGKKPALLTALHFPVGGSRFRPSLEDVLEMLIEEFGIHPVASVGSARKTLADAREEWRRKQIATVVRDAPSVAVQVLRDMGYSVESPDSGPEPDKPSKLRAI